MIDVYAAAGTFRDKHRLAQDLARAVMRWEAVPEIPLFTDNTAAFINDLPTEAISNAAGRSDYVRVQVLTPAGVLDRDKQLGVVKELTEIVARATAESAPAQRTISWRGSKARARAPEAAAAGTAGPALVPGNNGAAAQTGWQWTWTWEWQRDDQTAWNWDWSWSQPCDCSWSWDWDWNWDWRTPAPALNGTGAPPVPAGATVDPTVPLVANGPPRAADAAQVVLGPVAQANTAEASAAAGAQNQVTRITLTVANAQSPDIVQQVATASQRAEATASATQTAADNASIRLGNGETPQPLAATASAAPVGSTGSVGQSNASTTASVATTASSAVQSVLQAEVSGGPTAGMPSVDQQLHLGQVAVATSTAAQTGVANLAIADLSAGGPISIEQSSSATATASAADTSTVYQGSEQAQAGSASDQGVTQIALVGQTGSASASVEQTGAANTAVARGTHAAPTSASQPPVGGAEHLGGANQPGRGRRQRCERQ